VKEDADSGEFPASAFSTPSERHGLVPDFAHRDADEIDFSPSCFITVAAEEPKFKANRKCKASRHCERAEAR
jgi:hypothetical protein